MAHSPQHGDTAFTVPMFDELMKRVGREAAQAARRAAAACRWRLPRELEAVL
jgi:hypothetical protein